MYAPFPQKADECVNLQECYIEASTYLVEVIIKVHRKDAAGLLAGQTGLIA